MLATVFITIPHSSLCLPQTTPSPVPLSSPFHLESSPCSYWSVKSPSIPQGQIQPLTFSRGSSLTIQTHMTLSLLPISFTWPLACNASFLHLPEWRSMRPWASVPPLSNGSNNALLPFCCTRHCKVLMRLQANKSQHVYWCLNMWSELGNSIQCPRIMNFRISWTPGPMYVCL